MEQSPTIATNATTQAIYLAILKATCWFIVVRSLSLAHGANILANEPATSSNTSSSTQRRILSNADNAIILAKELAISRNTF